MKYTVEDHFKLHQRWHKKNWTKPINVLAWFMHRYVAMKRGDISYSDMIEIPLRNKAKKDYYIPSKRTKHLSLAWRCRNMNLNYQKVYQYLIKHPMQFNEFIWTTDLTKFKIKQDKEITKPDKTKPIKELIYNN